MGCVAIRAVPVGLTNFGSACGNQVRLQTGRLMKAGCCDEAGEARESNERHADHCVCGAVFEGEGDTNS